MEIRKATQSDIPQISSLYEQFFSYNALQQPTFYKPAIENGTYPKSVIESEKAALFICVASEQVVGFIHVAKDTTPPFPCFVPYEFASIIDLFVAPKFRKQGIGTKLIHICKEWAKAQKLNYLELNVLTENKNATRLYEKVNFRAVSSIMRCKI